MILRPAYIEKILVYADTPFVKILSGIRRSGKSTIMNMLVDVFAGGNYEGIKSMHIAGFLLASEY